MLFQRFLPRVRFRHRPKLPHNRRQVEAEEVAPPPVEVDTQMRFPNIPREIQP